MKQVFVIFIIPLIVLGSSVSQSTVVKKSFRVYYHDIVRRSYATQEASIKARERTNAYYLPILNSMADKINILLASGTYKDSFRLINFAYDLPHYVHSRSASYPSKGDIQIPITEEACIIDFNFTHSEWETYTVEIAVESLPDSSLIEQLYQDLMKALTTGDNAVKIKEPRVSKKRKKWFLWHLK